MSHYSNPEDSPPKPSPYLPIPLSKPFLSYVILAAIAIVWSITWQVGGSTSIPGEVLIRFGANFGPGILQGETWRLFTSMFLHADLRHLLFNAYALFIFGFEMERIYGPDRYLVIYILSGLFGSLASFAWRGAEVLSVGASGAIFGIIGMNLAFFLIHRQTFGEFGRSRVMSTLIIIGINLFLGFTVARIDNMAHLGGLIAGFALGYGLAPRYQLADQYTSSPRVVDTVTWLNRGWVAILAVLVLGGGLWAALLVWG